MIGSLVVVMAANRKASGVITDPCFNPFVAVVSAVIWYYVTKESYNAYRIPTF